MPEKEKKEDGKKEKKDKPQQMRYTVELFCAGASFYQIIHLFNMTDVELGCFVSTLAKFSELSYIGGKRSIGCGLVEIEYDWKIMGSKDPDHSGKFLSVSDDQFWMSKPASEAKDVYDSYLLDIYDRYLEENKQSITKMLGAA